MCIIGVNVEVKGGSLERSGGFGELFVCFNVNGGKNQRIIKIVITNAMRRRRM